VSEIYQFEGKIWPSNTTLDIPGQFGSTFDGAHSGQARGEVNDSKLVVYYEPNSSASGPLRALRDFLQRFVDGVIDTISFLTGRHLEAKIESAVVPGGEKHSFESRIPEATHIGEDRNIAEETNRVTTQFEGQSGTYLRLALKDYRSALAHPFDTGFYCYRSIESIRQSFSSETAPDVESWETMRTELDIKRRNLDYVKEFADDRRHGDLVEMDNEERRRVLVLTWGFIWDFVGYLGGSD